MVPFFGQDRFHRHQIAIKEVVMLVYKFEQISTPATYFEIVAASGNRVVGSRGNDAILWDGAIHALPLSGPTGSGSASAEARGVNSRGDIVGRWGGEGFVRR